MSNTDTQKTKWFFGGAIIATLGATVCCIVPLVLFSFGITSAWIGNLNAMTPYQPYFIIAAISFAGIGFWRIYKKPRAKNCKPTIFCAMPYSSLINKTMLWVAVGIILLVIVYAYIV